VNGNQTQPEAPTTDERSYATEWLLGARIRVIRKGEKFELVVKHHALDVTVEISEQQADQLRFLWL
jgi:hypothetical protein